MFDGIKSKKDAQAKKSHFSEVANRCHAALVQSSGIINNLGISPLIPI
jgi:hypothetical protein